MDIVHIFIAVGAFLDEFHSVKLLVVFIVFRIGHHFCAVAFVRPEVHPYTIDRRGISMQADDDERLYAHEHEA